MKTMNSEIDSNREFTKSFWQPDQDKCSFSLERIHLFPNLNYNGNLKHEDSNKDHDYSERLNFKFKANEFNRLVRDKHEHFSIISILQYKSLT